MCVPVQYACVRVCAWGVSPGLVFQSLVRAMTVQQWCGATFLRWDVAEEQHAVREFRALRELAVEGDDLLGWRFVSGEDSVSHDVLADGVAACTLVRKVGVSQGVGESSEVLRGVEGKAAKYERARGDQPEVDVIPGIARPSQRRVEIGGDFARAGFERGGEMVRQIHHRVGDASGALQEGGDAQRPGFRTALGSLFLGFFFPRPGNE